MRTTNQNVKCSIADSAEDRDAVYRLRYTCYRRKNSIEPRPDERFSDTYDALPNHFSILASCAGDAHATVRISVVRPDLGWNTAPAHKVFGDHPAFQPIAANSFVEASRLCFGQQARRDSLMSVVSYLAAMAEFYEIEWVVACPRVEHTPIYRRLFGLVQIAEPRRYFGVSFETSLLAIRRADLIRFTADAKSMDSARLAALGHLNEAHSASRFSAATRNSGFDFSASSMV